MKLVLTNNAEEVKSLVADGYCPIECSIGGESIIDTLQMDHHGENSHLEAVSIRAYRDHFGARSEDPRFVVVGIADADACFTVAALAGILPHPSRSVKEGAPPVIAKAITRDLTELATTIARVDCNPIGLNIPELPGGEMLLTWNAMCNNSRDTLGLHLGVGLWRSLCDANPAQIGPFLNAAKEAESNRVQASMADLDERGVVFNESILVIKGSCTFGFPEWYGRDESNSFDSLHGWRHPIVLAWLERGKNVTIGCPNQAVAEQLFGIGGLKNVLSRLKPDGWGGREAVGGSPRGIELTWEQVEAAVETINDVLIGE